VQIFELFGSVLLKDSGVESQLDKYDKKASSVGKSMGSSFSGIAGTALKLGAILGAGMGISDMISKASAGEQKLAQMDAVLKSTGGAAGMTKDELLKLADAQGKLTTFSKGANMETENLLLTFTSIGKNVFPDALKTVNDMSQALGQDTKSSAVQLGKALQDPIKGITALSRVGVNFTAGQKEAIAAMVKHGDVAGAQKVILAELAKEFGGSAEAAGKTFAGQMTIAKNQVSGLGSTIGSALLPTLTGLIKTVNDNMPKIKQVITDVVTLVTAKFKEWITIIGQIANELFPKFSGSTDDVKNKTVSLSSVLDIVTKALTFVRDNIEFVRGSLVTLGVVWLAHEAYIIANNIVLLAHNVVQAVKMAQDKAETVYLWLLITADKARAVATKASAVAQWALNAAMNANPIGIIIVLIVALVAGFVLLWNKNKTFHDFIVNSWVVIKRVVSESITAIVEFFQRLGASIVQTWDSIKTSTENVWNGIKQFFINIVSSIVQFVTDKFSKQIGDIKVIFASIKIIFENSWDIIKNIFLGAILLILDLVTGNFTKLKEDAGHIFTNLKDDFVNIWENIKNIFKYYVDLVQTTLSQAWTAIKSVTEAVWNGLKDFLRNLWDGIKSTAASAWTALKSSVINLCNSIVQGAKDIFNGLMAWFRALPSQLSTIGSNMGNSLKNGVMNTISGVKNAIVNGITNAMDWLRGMPSKMVGYGKDMIQGMIDGITGMVGRIGDAVSGVADKIRSFLHFSVPDEGPLTDYESWMPDFMSGMAKGIDSNKFKVIDSIKGLAAGVNVGMKLAPSIAGVGSTGTATSGSFTNQGSTIINFNGAYSFNDKKDIDYFMNESAKIVRRRQG